MNCRRVQRLIPLYIEGDLKSRLVDQVASHLEWCGRCNWLADEYEESQGWLRTFESPAFDDDAVADLKRNVLARTQELRLKPSFFASMAQHWGRRQVFALSAAVSILIVVLVFYASRQRTEVRSVPPSIADQSGDRTTKQPDEKRTVEKAENNILLTAPRRESGGRPRKGLSRPNSIVATRTDANPPVTRSDSASQRTVIEGPAKPADMLRIEIQTEDPNIRIIWFAPKEVGSPLTNPVTDIDE